MRRHAQQHLALGERLAHQTQCAVLQITQSAMDELAGSRGRAGTEVVHLDQQHAQATARRIAREAHPVDAAADDSEVEIGHEREGS
jgi:hypothetical protein